VTSYITGLAGGGTGYFTDAAGHPVLVIGDEPWGLVAGAGRWSSGDWQGEISAYLTSRAAQGYNALEIDLVPSQWNGTPAGSGVTWDGVPIFTGGTSTTPGNPSSGLNSAYWQRVDYLITTAAGLGMTLFANLGQSYDIDNTTAPAQALGGLTGTQYTDYGNKVATRYLSAPNLIWMIEDDYFGSSDTILGNILAGIRNAGDTRPIAAENYPESTSRKDLQTGAALSWGTSNAAYQWVYSYNVAYFGIEEAYKEASPLPVIRGDGKYYGNSGDEQLMRNHCWWALSSGSRGFFGGDDRIWQWASAAPAAVTTGTWQTTILGAIVAAFSALPGWHKLIPDTSSTFITAGRGTRATSLTSGGSGGQYSGTTDTWVTGSVAPDGSLAVIYMSHGSTITIDQSKMRAGYTATWIDPVTGATSPATAGSTYNSTAKGNNSQGDPDWVLALQGPAQVPPPPPVIRRSPPSARASEVYRFARLSGGDPWPSRSTP
jgi:Protein of unknown function (DUF4038)/Putative collagen-binding domain of a collagenase